MPEKEIDRKVAIILATDVVNYSKHMETNESETVKNLRACELILQRVIKKHGGRLFNSGGDSFFIEFPSAVEAVECAVAFQKDIKKRNSSDIITVPLEFRIGISMGDVIKEKENLLGDGVNIAARLEALAQTNGITISKNIYDLVKAKTSHQYNDLGIQKVKKNEFVIALDKEGLSMSTEKFRFQFDNWISSSKDISIIIGGPEGLSQNLIKQCDFCWSLSQLTFPHSIVPVLVLEQIYRVWSMTQNHPYHK